ncbi:DUF4097 domain-containing protein [Thalassotalea euphylliae]|uniref:DUF4097 family beta strand repeat-containing protein n=1 Tax=Thalassotalea euphylliae TaxID=1655234 RepID=UPI003624FD2F
MRIATILSITSLLLPTSVFAGQRIDESISAEGIALVNIENIRGEITIIGADTDTITAKGEIEKNAKRFVFEKSGNLLRIKADVRNSNNGRGSEYTVRLPNDVRVNFDGVSSDVKVENITGSTEVSTVSGDIEAENLTDNVELSTVSGEIDSKNLSGKVRLYTVSGSIDDEGSSGRIHMKAVSGDVRTESSATEVTLGVVSGDIRFRLGEVEELHITTVSGDADGSLSLTDNASVKMSGVSGDVSLNFTSEVNASFNLSATAGGDLKNRITSDKARRAKYGPSSKLQFTAGNGSASVKGSTVSGEISVSNR